MFSHKFKAGGLIASSGTLVALVFVGRFVGHQDWLLWAYSIAFVFEMVFLILLLKE